jgi:TetR/AcrR family transcriptional regulator, cholesterol catabolism regulator
MSVALLLFKCNAMQLYVVTTSLLSIPLNNHFEILIKTNSGALNKYSMKKSANMNKLLRMVKKYVGNFGFIKSFHSFAPLKKCMEQRERILAKANELYFRYGIRSVTMDEIAGQCGISKKTIYQFFEDKDALVTAVMDTVINKTECECIMDQQKSDNAIHEVFLALDMVQAMFSTMNPTILFDVQKHHPKAFQRLALHKSDFFFSVIKKNIERGKLEGIYREDINSEILAKLRLETAFLPFNQDLFPKGRYHVAKLEQEITEHFVYGMATLKGQKFIQKYKQERTKTLTT